MMTWINWIYYAIQRRRFGVSYGCGRCHHGHIFHRDFHKDTPCSIRGCPCKAYSTERTTSDAAGKQSSGEAKS